jgi:CheY-like chemotaxis protein
LFGVVLLVEDEWILRSVLAGELRRQGWQVVEASTAEDAISPMKQVRCVDVVVTDIQLAGRLTGWELAEERRWIDPALPIIYASGSALDLSRTVAGSIFVTKPMVPRQIVKACRKLITVEVEGDYL